MKVFTSNVEQIDKELEHLNALEFQVEENLKFLRKKHIIALALEYKKAKEELSRTKHKILVAKIDRDNITNANKDTQEILNKHKKAYADSLKQPNNVLIFKGKPNGQK